MSEDSITTTKPSLMDVINAELDKRPPQRTRLSEGVIGVTTDEQTSLFRSALERFGVHGRDLMEFFGVGDNMSSAEERKIQEIGVFLGVRGILKGGDLFQELGKLERRFGPPVGGESQLDRTHRFLSLLSDKEQITKKIKSMTKQMDPLGSGLR